MNPSEEQNQIIEDDSKDTKKLSKGQLKKLKEKAKKETAGQGEGAPEESTPATEATAEANGVDADDKDEGEGEAAGGDSKKGLSKGQLKKLKEKQKKEAEAAAAAAKKDEKPKEEEKEDKKDKKGAKKPMNAAAKLAQQRLEEMKRLEELRKQQEEELRRQEEEEERKREEEERRIREIEEAKKREKEEKIQKLKDEGKYRTKKEREREEALIRRREELIAQGVIPADTFAEQGEKPKSKVVRTKKPKKKEETQQETQQEETQEAQAETAEKKPEVESWEAEADVDDWEKFAEPAAKTEEKKEAAPKQAAKVEEKAKPVETKKAEEKPKPVETKPKVEEKPKEAPKEEAKAPVEEAPAKKHGKDKENAAAKFENKGPNDKIRSPIICILGHVDTGKTKLLDNMRRTNVQEGEAGGITQQIGATFFPYEKLEMEVAKTKSFYPVELEVPGLLIIDTPGHESFSNLRSRGSGLCDIAILVVDIMHGLEKQTLESIELLRFRKTPFVIALNKIDRLYGWKPKPDSSSYLSLKKQEKSTQLEFRDRSKAIITELTEKGFNVALYYDNPDPNTYVSMIPTSAMTGEGISDILSVAMNLTQKWLKKKITKKEEFKCTVLEVKVIEGLGASIDVMLVDGTLTEGDKIILAGYEGPIVTTVRALLTPHPMKEMRVKNEYIHHKAIGGAMGIKISANDLDKALAGSELYIIKKEGDEEMYREMLEEEIRKVKKSIKLVEEGVLVAASTLGSLEALLQFLKTSQIPVAAISIGPVSKAEVIKAMKPLQVVEGEVRKEYKI